MSWLIALRPGQDTSILDRIGRLHGPVSFSATVGRWHLLCGGPAHTAAGGTVDGGAWIRCGVDLRSNKGQFRLHVPPTNHLSGETSAGVLTVSCDADELRLTSDRSGLRTAYVADIGDATIATTRLDWIAKLSGGLAIDFEAFGSHWQCHNQLSWRSLLRGVRRLPPGGTLKVDYTGAQIAAEPWAPDPSDSPADFESVLRSALITHLPDGLKLSLGVSGGLDSRVLACLATEFDVRFHVFGSDHPDVRIARRLAHVLNRKIRVLDSDMPSDGDLIDLSRTHAVATCAIAPASAAVSLRHYDELRSDGNVVIDGGFGEIGRRQFMNRLLTSRKTIAERSPGELVTAVAVRRAEVFSEEASRLMAKGVLGDVEEAFHSRPAIDGWTDADQADLIAVRYRLPNFFGFEQGRLDGHVASFMPFATPAFLRSTFAAPIRDRQAGRAFRRIIRDLSPPAARLPLVKGTTTYPFSLSPLLAVAVTSAKAKLGFGGQDTNRARYLAGVHDYVRDTIQSADLRQCGVYNIERLDALVSEYYAGKTERGTELDWWLSFELWRQAVS